jgi:hypothetical protein
MAATSQQPVLVGQEYRGSIVKEIQEEITERPNDKIRRRLIITLTNGMQMMEDFFEDKIPLKDIQGDFQELEYTPIVDSPSAMLQQVAVEAEKAGRRLSSSTKSPTTTTTTTGKLKKKTEKLAAAGNASSSSLSSGGFSSSKSLDFEYSDNPELGIVNDEERNKKTEAAARKQESRTKTRTEMATRKWKNLISSPTYTEEKIGKSKPKKSTEETTTILPRDDGITQALWVFAPGSDDDDNEDAMELKGDEKPNSSSSLSSLSPSRRRQQGLWKLREEDDPNGNAKDWMGQNVTLFPTGKIPPDGVVQGVWGCKENKYLAITNNKSKSTTRTTTTTDPTEKDEIWLYPPGVTPAKEDPIHIKGQWAFTVDVQEAEASAAAAATASAVAKASKTAKAPLPTSPSTTSPRAITTRWPPPIDEQKVAAREARRLAATRGVGKLDTGRTKIFQPPKLAIYPPSKAPSPHSNKKAHGTWTIPKAVVADSKKVATSLANMEQWKVQEIQVYPQGKEPEQFLTDPNAIFGVWGYGPGCDPEEEDDDHFHPQNILTCPPGMVPDEQEDGWKVAGIWTFIPGPIKATWPPPTEVPTTKVIRSSALPVKATHSKGSVPNTSPNQRNLHPKKVNVYPPSYKKPSQPEIGKAFSTKGKSVKNDDDDQDGALHGIWVFNSGSDEEREEMENWAPQTVTMYETGTEPPPSSHDDEDDAVVTGLWGYAPGGDSVGDENDMPQLWFFAPGAGPKMENDWKPKGIWTVPKKDWLPHRPTIRNNPTTAKVYAKNTVPTSKTGKTKKTGGNLGFQGIWVYDAGADQHEDDVSWQTQDVVLYETGKEPKELLDPKSATSRSSSPIHGVWGFAPGTEFDKDGCCDLENLWFFAPGSEGPGDESWQPMGTWELTDDVLKPTTATSTPTAATVHTKENVPTLKRGKSKKSGDGSNGLQGIWVYDVGANENDTSWQAQDVILYKSGKEPIELLDPKSKSSAPVHGVWGYAPGTELDEHGCCDPEHLWFFAPGSEGPGVESWKPMGTWAFPVKQAWPPATSTRYVPKPLRKVGKLPNWNPVSVKTSWVPRVARAYPEKVVPKQNVHANTKPNNDQEEKEEEEPPKAAVWKFSSGSDDEAIDMDWEPQDVVMFAKDQEPENVTIGGQWGFAPDAEMDTEGDCLPEHTWVFGEGETPPDDNEWQPCGTWAFANSDEEKKQDPTVNGAWSFGNSTDDDDDEPQHGEWGDAKDNKMVTPRRASAPASPVKINDRQKVLAKTSGYGSSDDAPVVHSTMSGWQDPFNFIQTKGKKKKKRGTYI